MKHIFFLMAAILAASAACLAQKVPAAVKTAFAAKFPGATGVKWDKENAHEYEAGFKNAGQQTSANFSDSGEWLETETKIDITELPQKVTEAVQKRYPGSAITEADSIVNNKNETRYEVVIKTGKKKRELFFTADGAPVK